MPWGGERGGGGHPVDVPILSVKEEGLARLVTFLNFLALEKALFM